MQYWLWSGSGRGKPDYTIQFRKSAAVCLQVNGLLVLSEQSRSQSCQKCQEAEGGIKAEGLRNRKIVQERHPGRAKNCGRKT